jgi:uncharacterized low-complexity protein
MEKKNTKKSIITKTIIAGALLTFSVNVDARPTTDILGSGAEVRSEIIDLNINSSTNNLLELKCGEAEKTTKKSKVKKEGKATEAKCGEGKCGEDVKKSDSKKLDTKVAKTEKSDKKGKTTEAKCGEGKCGAE